LAKLTALEGSAALSRITTSTLRPSRPPFSLRSATAMWKPQSWACAFEANMPVTAAIQPMRIGLFCAIAGVARAEARPTAPALTMTWRRPTAAGGITIFDMRFLQLRFLSGPVPGTLKDRAGKRGPEPRVGG